MPSSASGQLTLEGAMAPLDVGVCVADADGSPGLSSADCESAFFAKIASSARRFASMRIRQ